MEAYHSQLSYSFSFWNGDMAVGKSPAHDLVTQFKIGREEKLSKLGDNLELLNNIVDETFVDVPKQRNHRDKNRKIKLCDGLDITLGDFFSTPEFDTLEQEIK